MKAKLKVVIKSKLFCWTEKQLYFFACVDDFG